MAPKKDRAAAHQRSAHYSSHIQVYNVDNTTASPSVLLFFDNKRYLFNAGEGIQRHFIEYKQKMNKITSVLATRVSTDTLAGLPGMLLSQVAVGSDGLGDDAVKGAIFGPQGLSHYCNAFRQYAASFKLDVTEIGASSNQAVVQDSFVTITPVTLTPSSSSSSSQAPTNTAADTAAAETGAAAAAADGGPPDAAEQGPAAKRQRTDSSSTAAAGDALGRGMSPLAPLVVCYVCQLSTIPGKFDPQKAAQLGVPRGPLFGELQRGSPVTTVNGRTIQPCEVMESPEIPGACLLLLDCPSLAYLPSLQASPQLQQLQQAAAQQAVAGDGAAGISSSAAANAANGSTTTSSSSSQAAPSKKFILIHLGPSDVTGSGGYQAWLSGFGPGVQHLLVASDSQLSTTTQRAAVLQAQLNVIEPQVFSLQGFEDLLQQGQTQQQVQQGQQQQGQQGGGAAAGEGAGVAKEPAVVAAGNGCRYTLAPFRHQGLSLTDVSAAPDLAGVQASVHDSKPPVVQLLEQYKAHKEEVQQQSTPPWLEQFGRRSCELTLLGTCSACPSNHRNVSAYYLDLFDRGGLLMDCGEDAMGQLERRYGRTDAARRISQLHAVWVSHMHADHHGGLYPLLMQRQHLQQQQAAAAPDTGDSPAPRPLLILGPWPLFRVLCEYSKVLSVQFQFLPNTYFYAPAPRPPPAAALEAYEAVKAAAGLEVLQPFPVQHVSHSSGLQLKSSDGWKVVFSGDTRPCQSVIDAAQDATLLVHEATFEDELQDEAIAKKHSTTAEALSVATASRAYRTVLTHFSTRYPKIPVMKPPLELAAARQAAAADGSTEAGGEGAGSAVAAAASGSDLAAHGSVVVGFDLMSINIADLAWLPKMLPVLDKLFKEEEQAYQRDEEAPGEA